jgi:hypothetical protein
MPATISGSQSGTLGLINVYSAVATTSGTSIDFTGIPAGAKRVTLMLSGVSTTGTSQILVQIGTSGGVAVSGYQTVALGFSTTALAAATGGSGFLIEDAGAATYARYGNLVITNVTGTTWNAAGTFVRLYSSGYSSQTTGNIALAGTLDRVRLTTLGGTDTFDAGSANIFYE